MREVLNDDFVERGYVVFSAADGEEALATFTREGPDVVLLDVRMPGLDGLHVLKRLRETDSLGDADFGAAPPGPWSRLVTDVFRSVRGMDPEARASTGVRLEDAVLPAARQAMAGRLAEAASHLTEIKLLVTVATSLGDLPATGRSVIDSALETAEAALPLR